MYDSKFWNLESRDLPFELREGIVLSAAVQRVKTTQATSNSERATKFHIVCSLRK